MNHKADSPSDHFGLSGAVKVCQLRNTDDCVASSPSRHLSHLNIRVNAESSQFPSPRFFLFCLLHHLPSYKPTALHINRKGLAQAMTSMMNEVVALAQTAIEITEFLSTVRNAPQEIRTLHLQADSIKSILQRAQSVCVSLGTDDVAEIKRMLHMLVSQMDKLKALVNDHKRLNSPFPRLTWPKRKKELGRILQEALGLKDRLQALVFLDSEHST